MKLVVLAIAASATVVATGAVAQDSTTSCTQIYNTVNCDTRAAPAAGGAAAGFARGFSDSFEREGGLSHILERRRQMMDERRQKARNAEVGKLIAAGRCADARSYALTAGDLDLAQRVASFCPAPAAP